MAAPSVTAGSAVLGDELSDQDRGLGRLQKRLITGGDFDVALPAELFDAAHRRRGGTVGGRQMDHRLAAAGGDQRPVVVRHPDQFARRRVLLGVKAPPAGVEVSPPRARAERLERLRLIFGVPRLAWIAYAV